MHRHVATFSCSAKKPTITVLIVFMILQIVVLQILIYQLLHSQVVNRESALVIVLRDEQTELIVKHALTIGMTTRISFADIAPKHASR